MLTVNRGDEVPHPTAKTVAAILSISKEIKSQTDVDSFSVENKAFGLKESWAQEVCMGANATALIRIMIRYGETLVEQVFYACLQSIMDSRGIALSSFVMYFP